VRARSNRLDDVEQAVSGLNTSFLIVFSVAAVVFVGLLIYVAVWAIRRDAEGRRRWVARQEAEAEGSPEP
jgi:F0F1-type ATP synthase membrane subunit b/b'